jgi:hypothetical protein
MEINLIPYSPLLQWPPTTSHVSPHIILQHNNTLNTMNFQLRATAPMLSMWPCKLKLDEEKSNHAGLAQQNAFGPAFLHSLTRLIKCTAKLLAPTRKECNEYDMTVAPCFWLANYNDWSRCFAISSLPPICTPSFSLWVRLENKNKKTSIWKEYFCGVTSWAPLEMLLV